MWSKKPVVDLTLDSPVKQTTPSPVFFEKRLPPSILEHSSDSTKTPKIPNSKASVTFAQTSIKSEDPIIDLILKPTALDAGFLKAKVNAKGMNNICIAQNSINVVRDR